ncbi:MAG: TadE/TadG family type IV pilus assembly protein [Phycisphaeraceae bacterium]
MNHKRDRRARRGLATLETALVLPLLLLLTFGVLEYGWMFWKLQDVTSATRHGARQAVLPDSTTAGVEQAVADMLADRGLGGTGYTIAFSPGDVMDAERAEAVRVTVRVPYSPVSLTNFRVLPMPEALEASVTMAKEGP